MSDRSTTNTPNMHGDFEQSSEATFDRPLEYDAATWEPMEEHVEEPSEKHLEMHYTPGGTLEQDVHTQLDAAARERIIEAQRQEQGVRELEDEKELDLSGEFDRSRRNDWGWDPESTNEYDNYLNELPHDFDRDPFDTGRRFERQIDREQGEHEWER